MVNTSETKERREAIMKKLGNGVLILPSLPESIYSNDVHHVYRQHSDMLYYVGFPEPNTTCVIENKDGVIETHLFVPERNELFETWNGRRYGVEGALNKFKVEKAYINDELEEILSEILRDHESVFMKFGSNEKTDTLVRECIAKTLEARDLDCKGPVNILNPIYEIDQQKVIKSELEVEYLRKAAEISADAHTRAMKVTKPGMGEWQIEAILNYEFRKNGATTYAYPSIVGSGINGTILHYIENSSEMQDGDLLLVDAGCEYNGYTSDITRTWPINGKFSEAQKEVYQLVLDVQKICIAYSKPGNNLWDMQDMAIKLLTEGLVRFGLLEGDIDQLIEEKEYRRFFMHGLGHWLGNDTHDTSKIDKKKFILKSGCCYTVEPGIYIPDEEDIPEKYRGIAVRIEDDILITNDGYEVLSKSVVKEISDIEEIVGIEDLP